ncbi:MAG: hypothetical protein IKF07_06780 [Eubacterium sp.]|nr:hypothetical protein [Eubacterium sp.]
MKTNQIRSRLLILFLALLVTAMMLPASIIESHALENNVIYDGVGNEQYFNSIKITLSGATVASVVPDDSSSTTIDVTLAADTPANQVINAAFTVSAKSGFYITSGTPRCTLSGGQGTITTDVVACAGAPNRPIGASAQKFTINLVVAGNDATYDVTLPTGQGFTVVPEAGSVSPVTKHGNYSFSVNIADGFKKGSNFAVKVNGAVIEPVNDIYTITDITEEKTITVEDVVSQDTVNQYDIVLPQTGGVIITPEDGYSSPVDEGSDYKFKVSIDEGYEATESFAVKDNDVVITADSDGVYTISDIHEHHAITVTGIMFAESYAVVTAPAGSTVTAGTFGNYFVYSWKDPVRTKNNGNGTSTYYFDPISGTTFYRVQHPEGVTYWDYQPMTAGKSYTVTMDDLTKNGTMESDTIYHDFVYNYLDLGDVYLNINEKNYLSLANGGTRTLSVFRNWQAIEGFTNAKIAAPDVHYEVVDINGNPSDLVTVEPDAHNSGYATINASSSGTGLAVIKVTYDAMIYKQGYASGYGAGGQDVTRFTAIWPECTGVIVVTVGQSGTAPGMGMTINTDHPEGHAGKVAGNNIDAEHDLLYYFGDDGAEYTFTPDGSSTVSVARCTVGEHDLSFSGFTTEGVIKEGNNVTVTGLTAGRHIVKVEKNGVANYQVLSARKVTVTARDASHNQIQDWETRVYEPGDSIELIFHNVNSPQEKLQGCYNNSFTIYYMGENGQRLAQSNNGGGHGYGQYNFSSLDVTATIAIPDDWTGKTYSATHGAVAMAGFSGTAAGGHRSKSFGAASGMATGTAGKGVLGKLPDITLKVKQPAPTVEVDFTSQMSGGFLHAPKFGYEVAGDLAENYGYEDSVDGVSALDVLVAAHELVYGDEFTTQTADTYLEIASSGSPTKQFGIDMDDYYGGFFVNHCFPNDGTMLDDGHYYGTTAGTQAVQDGDLVEFFFYEDDYLGDTYNWFTDSEDVPGRSFSVLQGEDLSLTLKGFYAMESSLFRDADEMMASDDAYEIEDAQIFMVDPETGALTEIDGAVTDDEGKVTLNFDKAGEYTIAAYGNDDCMFTQILSLTKINVTTPPGQITSANVVLENDITMKLYATFAEEPDEGSISMNVTMNGEGTEIPGTLQSDGRYVFRYQDISPEYIGDEFDAVMTYAVNGEQFTDTLENYSVKKYCMKTLELLDQNKLTLPPTATEEETRILMVDTLFYGAEAQNYKDHNTDRLATSDLTDEEKALATEYVRPTADEGVISPLLTGTKDDNHYWYSASVMLDNSARLKLFFMAPNGIDGLTVTAGGEEREIKTTGTANKYYVEVTDIAADAFGDRIETSFSVDGQATGQVFAYNINTYVTMTDEHATFGPMAQRLYNYGRSSKAYATA